MGEESYLERKEKELRRKERELQKKEKHLQQKISKYKNHKNSRANADLKAAAKLKQARKRLEHVLDGKKVHKRKRCKSCRTNGILCREFSHASISTDRTLNRNGRKVKRSQVLKGYFVEHAPVVMGKRCASLVQCLLTSLIKNM